MIDPPSKIDNVDRTPGSLQKVHSMWNYLWNIGGFALDYTGRLDRNQWIIVFVVCLVVGFICTRGFGSRTNY